MQLRDYQHEAIKDTLQAWLERDRVLVTMPTGTGKTIVFLALLDSLIQAGDLRRGLVLVDQVHLVDQPLEKIEAFYPHLLPLVGCEQGSRSANGHKIVVATWQTLESGDRLQRFIDTGGFSHVIVDEAHVNIDAQKRILDRLPGAKVAGFTATPRRADDRSLAEVYHKKPAYQLLLPNAIRRGALVPFFAYEAYLPISLEGVRKIGDSWDSEQVGKLYRAENVMQIVLEAWRKQAKDRTTIAYTSSVLDAQEFAAYFTKSGVAAGFVHGGTPTTERDRIKADLEAGRLTIVFNCAVWIKGFDLPQASAIMIIRPTRSATTIMQMMGRGLRTHPQKDDCVVLSFAPVCNPDVVMAGDLISPSIRRAVAAATGEAGVGLGVRRDGRTVTIDPGRIQMRAVELLGRSALAWFFGDDPVFWSAGVNKEHSICIVLPDPDRLAKAEELAANGNWNDGLEAGADFIGQCRVYEVNRTARFLGAFQSFDEAKAKADEVARGLGIDDTLAKKARQWRQLPVTRASEGKRYGQVEMLRYYGVDPSIAANRGEAAQLITHAKCVKTTKEADDARFKQIVRENG